MAINTNKYKLYNYHRPDMFNVDIDMRWEMNGLTEEFGIDALYVRNCKFVKCKCYNELHQTGDADCMLCGGTGYLNSIEPIKLIESSVGRPYSWDNFLEKLNIGITDQKYEVLYIQQYYNPKERDFVIKCTWDHERKIPIDILKVYEIAGVYEIRGDNGRIELNGCATDLRTDLVDSFSKTLKSMPNNAISTLLKGGKYIWPSNLIQK